MVLAAAAAPIFLPGNRAVKVQAIEGQAPTPPQCSDAKLLCCRSRLLGSDNKYFEAESAVGSWSTLRLRGKNCLTDSAWPTLLLFGVCPVLKLVCRDLAYGYNEKT